LTIFPQYANIAYVKVKQMKKYGFFLIMIVFATQSYGLWAQNHYDKSSPGIGISNHRFILEQEKNKTLRDVII